MSSGWFHLKGRRENSLANGERPMMHRCPSWCEYMLHQGSVLADARRQQFIEFEVTKPLFLHSFISVDITRHKTTEYRHLPGTFILTLILLCHWNKGILVSWNFRIFNGMRSSVKELFPLSSDNTLRHSSREPYQFWNPNSLPEKPQGIEGRLSI